MLAKQKIPLFLTARNAAALALLEKELSSAVPVISCVCDLTSPTDLKKLLEAISLHSPDCVINSAGIGFHGEALSRSLDEALSTLKINVEALTAITLEAARTLKAKQLKGTILNISSAAANFTYPGFAIYSASKRYVKEFSLSLDAETAKHGIRILTSLPGKVDTPFLEKASKVKKRSPWKVMSAPKVASLMINQIAEQKGCLILDFRYHLLAFFAHFLPKSLLSRLLAKESSED